MSRFAAEMEVNMRTDPDPRNIDFAKLDREKAAADEKFRSQAGLIDNISIITNMSDSQPGLNPKYLKLIGLIADCGLEHTEFCTSDGRHGVMVYFSGLARGNRSAFLTKFAELMPEF